MIGWITTAFKATLIIVMVSMATICLAIDTDVPDTESKNHIDGNTAVGDIRLDLLSTRERVREIRARLAECRRGNILGNGQELASLIRWADDYRISPSSFSTTARQIRRWEVGDNYLLAQAILKDCQRGMYLGARLLLNILTDKHSGVTPDSIGTTIYDARWYVRAEKRWFKRLEKRNNLPKH